MTYCGIDIGGLSSYVYLTDASGKKKWSGPVPSTKAGFAGRLRRYVRAGLRIAIEAGNQTAWIYRRLVEMGAEVTVVNPQKVKWIAESRKKTDKIDAKILCELLRLDGLPEPVHMPSPQAREVRGLLVARRQLLTARTKLQNVVRGLLRQEGVQLAAGELTTFKGWKNLLAFGFDQDHLLRIVTVYYDSFVSLTRSLRQLEKDLAEQEQQDQRAQRLQTMPKVGRIASLTLLAAVDDVNRFASSKKLVGATRAWLPRFARAASGASTGGSAGRDAKSCGRCGCRWPTWWQSTAVGPRSPCGAGSTGWPSVGAARRRSWPWPDGCW